MIHHEVQQQESPHQSAVIKLIGVGGGGCNAVEQMIAADIHGVDFTCVNTDAQALAKYHPDHVIQLGNDLTRGLGAGTDPEVGRLAAEADRDLLASVIDGTDMLFLTAGMGGGTGTGAISVIAQIARELGVLTVAVVTKPFSFEGGKRHRVAEAGIADLRDHVDSLIVVPNENLLTHLGPNISLIDAFAASNDVLTNAVQSIAELITNPGLINVDFADVKSVMTEMGEAMMSTGRGIGDFRARDAAIAATESPLLAEIDLKEARGILANITASADLSMGEFQIVGDILDQITADNANVVIGTVFDQRMKDEIRVTVVATGLNTSPPVTRAIHRPKTEKRQSRTSRLLSFGSAKKSKKAKKADNRRPLSAAAESFEAPQPKPSILKRDTPQRSQPEPQPEPQPDTFYRADDSIERQHTDPVVDDIRDQISDEAVLPELIAKPCIACGNSMDSHTANCPRAPKAAFEISGEKATRNFDQLSDYISQLTDEAPKPAVPHVVAKQQLKKPEFATGPKKTSINKHMAGLIAGICVLFTVFYVVVTNTLASNNDSLVNKDNAPSTLADRKLRAANRRLSGIDE